MAGGMRVRLVTPEAAKLTRQMNGLGKASRPIFVQAGDRVAKLAQTDLRYAAASFSPQAAGLARSIRARRDRVPYVNVNGGALFRLKPGGRRRDAVRAKHIARGVEYGSREHPQFTRAHGTLPQNWRPGGYWWSPTVRQNQDRYTRQWLDALDRVLAETLGRL
jgi:hypothetical protein